MLDLEFEEVHEITDVEDLMYAYTEAVGAYEAVVAKYLQTEKQRKRVVNLAADLSVDVDFALDCLAYTDDECSQYAVKHLLHGQELWRDWVSEIR